MPPCRGRPWCCCKSHRKRRASVHATVGTFCPPANQHLHPPTPLLRSRLRCWKSWAARCKRPNSIAPSGACCLPAGRIELLPRRRRTELGHAYLLSCRSRGANLVPTASRAAPRIPSLLCPSHRSFLGIAGREMNEKWDDKGAGAVFFLEQEMSDAVSGERASKALSCAATLLWRALVCSRLEQDLRALLLAHAALPDSPPCRPAALGDAGPPHSAVRPPGARQVGRPSPGGGHAA